MKMEIVIQGLIALVPHYMGDGPEATQMTALLLDSHKVPTTASSVDPDGICFDPHHAMISFYTEAGLCEDADGCTSDGSLCECTLSRVHVSLEATTPAAKPFALPTEKPQPLPFNKEAAGSPAYVANFDHLGVALDRSYVEADNPKDQLAARFEFPFDSLLACRLGHLPDDESHNVHSMRLRQPNQGPEASDLVQAVAQQLVAHVEIADDQPVKLVFRSLGDTPTEIARFQLKEPRIVLNNHRTEPMNEDDICNDGVGRDFGMLYEFALEPPAMDERRIPFVKHTQFKNAADITPSQCPQTMGPLSRPICPMAMFGPVSAAGGAAP